MSTAHGPGSTAFAYEAIVAACDECGAPRPLGAAGSQDACHYCGNDAAPFVASRTVPRAQTSASEPERLLALAAQDRGLRPLPRDLEPFFVGPDLVPSRVSEALAQVAAARAALRSGPAPADELRLHRLTAGLASYFARCGDALRERSLLEGALSVLREPRYRQSVCAALARGACRLGDLPAAWRWLEACDPRPLDLEADTAYRYAYAYLCLAGGHAERALEALADGIPLADEHEPECVALRAHACEELGGIDRAIATLDGFFANAGALARCRVLRFVEQHAGRLCPRSAPVAIEHARERGVRLAGKQSGAPLLLLAICAGLWLVLAIATLIVFVFAGLGWAFYAVGIGGLVPVVVLVVTVADLRLYARLRHLRRHGSMALARVLDVRSTKQSTLGVPEVRYRLLVLPPTRAPFEGYATFYADRDARARCAPRALVVVRADPDDPSLLAIEVD